MQGSMRLPELRTQMDGLRVLLEMREVTRLLHMRSAEYWRAFRLYFLHLPVFFRLFLEPVTNAFLS